jgi:hypothetical protein
VASSSQLLSSELLACMLPHAWRSGEMQCYGLAHSKNMCHCASTADNTCGSQSTLTFTASANVRYVAVLDSYLGRSPSGTPYAVRIARAAGCPGAPCPPPTNPIGGGFACAVDSASGLVPSGNTCTLTCDARYTPSAPTITCLDGVLGSATCIGAR